MLLVLLLQWWWFNWLLNQYVKWDMKCSIEDKRAALTLHWLQKGRIIITFIHFLFFSLALKLTIGIWQNASYGCPYVPYDSIFVSSCGGPLKLFSNFVSFFPAILLQVCLKFTNVLNLLKPTGHVMQNSLTVNNCMLCPHCIYVFCIYLRANSDLCHLHHKVIGFYKLDEKCLLRGTNWVFK